MTMTVNLSGVFAPVVTTFSPRDGELDIEAFESNVAAHMAAGLHGVVVSGSTGGSVVGCRRAFSARRGGPTG